MEEKFKSIGKTTIAPEVLHNIVRLTALSVPGVSRLNNVPASVNRLFRTVNVEGVLIDVEDNTVYADIYVVLAQNVNIREVGHAIQANVSRAISEMVGMEVGRVSIHVDDIDYEQVVES